MHTFFFLFNGRIDFGLNHLNNCVNSLKTCLSLCGCRQLQEASIILTSSKHETLKHREVNWFDKWHTAFSPEAERQPPVLQTTPSLHPLQKTITAA